MVKHPDAVAFDIIGTTFSMERLRPRLTAAGLPAEVLELWIAQSLRDAFALAASDSFQPFRSVLEGNLLALVRKQTGSSPPSADVMDSVMAGFGDLQPHPDAADAVEQLRSAGLRVVALTNGAGATTSNLLETAGLARHFAEIISVDDIGTFKPRREIYEHTAGRLEVEPSRLALIASHPWDIQGAASAGLVTGFVKRGSLYPSFMQPPTVQGEDLVEVAQRLIGLAKPG